MATEGYPVSTRTGDPIEGLDDAAELDGVNVFHAGTRREGDAIVTAGGRVLAVTATASTLSRARDRAYEAVATITWPGAQHRTDIARGLQ
jgi:phosphoribosylamine--glycine ligase